MDMARRASAHNWMGQAIHNLQGERLGELADIVFDTATGQIVYGVLSVGGVLGVGDKLFAVPWSVLHRDGEQASQLRLDASLDRLRSAPGFDKDHWPDQADAGFVERTHTAYT